MIPRLSKDGHWSSRISSIILRTAANDREALTSWVLTANEHNDMDTSGASAAAATAWHALTFSKGKLTHREKTTGKKVAKPCDSPKTTVTVSNCRQHALDSGVCDVLELRRTRPVRTVGEIWKNFKAI